MKSQYIILLLFVFYFISSFQLFKTNSWNELKEATHQLGFCIYKIDEPNCKKHSQLDSTTNLPRVFPLEEEWASERLKGWSETQNTNINDGLILFDLVQEHTLPKKSFNSFLILNLSTTHLESSQISIQNEITYLTLKGNKIVYCTMWREFGTGRGGVLVEEMNIEFRNNSSTKVKNFIEKLDKYQKLGFKK
ncbi:hypothetical protein ACE193_13145 [Bernardetia sp. OM2101]|uniref:hypothetical protein n=1 Tax=Bernardetia sp. OM2101 TaxID=3344876 RepID=UPI0035D0AF04